MLAATIKGFLLRALPEQLLKALKKIHYARTLEALTPTDAAELQVVRRLVRPGDWVVDVGATSAVLRWHCLSSSVRPAACTASSRCWSLLKSCATALGRNG